MVQNKLFRWLLYALLCISGIFLLSIFGVWLFYIWVQGQIYSAEPLELPQPKFSTQANDIQNTLLQTGKVMLNGEQLSSIFWMEKPQELHGLWVEIGLNDNAESNMRIQASIEAKQTSTPYINIDTRLSFQYIDGTFVEATIHNCMLGQLDLSDWCKETDIRAKLSESLEQSAQENPILQSTLELIHKAYLEEDTLVIELKQDDLLRSILDQLNSIDPEILEQLDQLELPF
jgi:hypothetical protein